MKSLLVKAISFAVLMLWSVNANSQKVYELSDVSGTIRVVVSVDEGRVTYSVSKDGEVLIRKSPISMSISNGDVWGKEARVKRVKRRSVDEDIFPPVYRKDRIENEYNEMTISFKGDYSLVFRAFEDGVAYRFASDVSTPFKVVSEEASFNLPDGSKVYAAFPKGRMNDGKEDPFYSSFQNTYEYMSLKEWNNGKFAMMPLLVETASGKKLCITEADLLNYPGMYLQNNSTKDGLQGVFAKYPKKIVPEVRGLKGVVKEREDFIAKYDGKTTFPWRAVVIADEDKELLDNDMVYKLASPAVPRDYSWIKPGKVAWDWWNNWSLYNVDFRAGINTETYKYYIDFASKNGIEYVILDEGWAVPGAADLMKIVPEIDLKEIIAHAESKNVGIILWAGYLAFDKDMDKVCKHYADMGVKGFKIDFMDRDDQIAVDFNRRAAETGAKYKLLIDLHGTFKPTGLQRTYPNTVNFEGVHGLEELKWAKEGTDQVTYDVTFPFIRMVAGPVDYTQGAMVNANKENFRAVYSEPMSQGTRCRQLAEYVIFESPLNMLCDSPTNYEKEQECTSFIAAIPTVWNETRPLQSKIGEYIVMARRKGNVWYVGGITNWQSRDVELDLSFLGDGAYHAEIFKDGVNADLVAKDYKKEHISVSSETTMKIHLAPGGGFIMKITSATD